MSEGNRIDSDLVEELRELMEGDFDTLLNTFISDSETKLTAIENAIAAENCDDLRRTSHSLKGSSSNLGAIYLSDLCFELEKLGRDNRLDQAPAILVNLKSALLDAKVYYQSLLTPR